MQVLLAALPYATTVGALLGVVDAVLRLLKGRGPQLAVVELPVALLQLAAAFPPAHRFVATSIPVGTLAIALEVALVALIVWKAGRRGSLLWITVAALVVNGVAAVLPFVQR
jgi:hypothetical protein